ncbi:hypothetical protein [Paraglaciecola sp. 2405UD69-4]|uniref:hypothetical protein n=1 Tax=Paraglaciecola sp. 2405UD69-4 TaxID=3391836 RepID=UPI0039C9827C
MKMRLKRKTGIVLTCLPFIFLSQHSSAQEQTQQEPIEGGGLAVVAKVSTLGPGIELDYSFNENWNLRLQGNGYTYSDTFEEDDIDYNGEIELSTYGMLVDWRPFGGVFRVSGGAYINDNELRGSAISAGSETFEIGDLEYRGSSSDPLTLDTAIVLGDETAGYLGFGWGQSYEDGFMFSLEIGVLFSGEPDVQLEVAGTAEVVGYPGYQFDVNGDSPEAMEFQANVDQEVASLQEDISDFEVYPVIALGIGYRF